MADHRLNSRNLSTKDLQARIEQMHAEMAIKLQDIGVQARSELSNCVAEAGQHVDATVRRVEHALDVRRHVDRHPIGTVLAAAGMGFLWSWRSGSRRARLAHHIEQRRGFDRGVVRLKPGLWALLMPVMQMAAKEVARNFISRQWRASSPDRIG